MVSLENACLMEATKEYAVTNVPAPGSGSRGESPVDSLIQDKQYLKRLTLLYVEDEEDTREQFTICTVIQRFV